MKTNSSTFVGSNQLNGNYISDKVFFDTGFTDQYSENPQQYDGMGVSLVTEYDAVFLGMGTYRYVKGGFPGEDLPGCQRRDRCRV